MKWLYDSVIHPASIFELSTIDLVGEPQLTDSIEQILNLLVTFQGHKITLRLRYYQPHLINSTELEIVLISSKTFTKSYIDCLISDLLTNVYIIKYCNSTVTDLWIVDSEIYGLNLRCSVHMIYKGR